jgi:hypothetical protein
VVLLKRALSPLAVLAPPVMLLRRALSPLAVLAPPVVLLKGAPAPSAVLELSPLVVLVSGVQVPPMVAFDPTHVSVPGAAMVAFASAMSKNDATNKFKLSGLFMLFPPNPYLDSSHSLQPVNLLAHLPL